jgi:Flp pilus assembly protein TadG
MTSRSRRNQRGSVVVEMGLIFIPMVIGSIAAMELGRCMWTYHTLNSAIKRATRFAIVHGARCAEASTSCASTVAQVATVVKTQGLGLNPANLQLTLAVGTLTRSCSNLGGCLQDANQFPAFPNNAAGLPVTLSANYEFPSVLAYLLRGNSSNAIRFTAKSTEAIQF